MSWVHDVQLVVKCKTEIGRRRDDKKLYIEDSKAGDVEVGEESLPCGQVEGGSEDARQAAILGVT